MDKGVGASSKDVIQMWKRLGDCSTNHKNLTVTVDGIEQNFTFTENYLETKPSETTLMNIINSYITNATIKKYIPSFWDNVNTDEKVYVIAGEGGLLEGQYIKSDYSVCEANTSREDVFGRVLEDGAEGELVQVWKGNGFVTFMPNGEYGIGGDGKLSLSASVKIGKIDGNNTFYLN